jgi:tyrosine-protein kinase Etk/Wzc
MEMMKASMMSSVRVLSNATYPTSRIPVNKRAIVFGSILFGLMLSLAIIFIRHVLSPVIEDPDAVERAIGIAVAAIIPFSQKQMSYNKKIKLDKLYANNNPFLLARENSSDISIEGIRSLRTTVQMSLLEAKNNVIAITGCSPGVGKSFISSNLAMVLSDLGKRVVIVDSDIRLGKLCQSFGKEKVPGLSCYLKNEATLDQVIQNVVPGKLDLISTGLYPENPSELLSQNLLPELIKTLSSRYDLVVIDTPPILAVTDSALILRYSSINLMVLGVGKDQMKEVLHAKAILEKGAVILTGVVFNTLKQQKSGFGYNYGYANYHYTYGN